MCHLRNSFLQIVNIPSLLRWCSLRLLPVTYKGRSRLFLLQGGTIRCRVTASRYYSEDLPQGGLEIPCILMFEGSAKDVVKVNKIVKYVLSSGPEAATKDEPPNKPRGQWTPRIRQLVIEVLLEVGIESHFKLKKCDCEWVSSIRYSKNICELNFCRLPRKLCASKIWTYMVYYTQHFTCIEYDDLVAPRIWT